MAPRTTAQNQALRDSTRTRILDGALRAFSAQGYEGASVRRIASESGVALGLMYSQFDGKVDVLRAIFERSMDDVRASFAQADGPAAPMAAGPLAGLIQSAFAILKSNLAFWKLTYGVRMQEPVLKALGPELEAWTGQILATLEAWFRATGAAQPELEAAILFAAIDGISQHYAMDPARYPLDAVAAALIAKYSPPPTRHPGRTGNRKAAANGKRESRNPGKPPRRGRR